MSNPDLGLKVLVALGAPGAENQEGYGALTWVEMAGTLNLPQRGDTHADNSETELGGRTTHWSGAVDGGAIEIPIAHKDGDAGQALLKANVGNNQPVSFQEVHPDGTATFFYGVVHGLPERQTDANSRKGYLCSVGVNSARFAGDPVDAA